MGIRTNGTAKMLALPEVINMVQYTYTGPTVAIGNNPSQMQQEGGSVSEESAEAYFSTPGKLALKDSFQIETYNSELAKKLLQKGFKVTLKS